MFERRFPVQDLSVGLLSLMALFPACLGSRPAAGSLAEGEEDDGCHLPARREAARCCRRTAGG